MLTKVFFIFLVPLFLLGQVNLDFGTTSIDTSDCVLWVDFNWAYENNYINAGRVPPRIPYQNLDTSSVGNDVFRSYSGFEISYKDGNYGYFDSTAAVMPGSAKLIDLFDFDKYSETDFTLTLWVKYDGTSNTTYSVLVDAGSAYLYYFKIEWIAMTGQYVRFLYVDGATLQGPVTPNLDAGNWWFIAAQYDTTNNLQIVWVGEEGSGTLDSTRSVQTGLAFGKTTSSRNMIGAERNNTAPDYTTKEFNGWISFYMKRHRLVSESELLQELNYGHRGLSVAEKKKKRTFNIWNTYNTWTP